MPALVFTLLVGSGRCVCASFEASTVMFNRDIRPILSENCFYCHGPDKNHRKGKFRLDDRDSAVAKKAIVPGEPAKSELIARIHAADPEELMPPPASNKHLSDTQKELLRRWIAQGAAYQPFWAYAPLQRPPLPPVSNATRSRNPIDAFILQKIDESKIAPSREADRRTLLRRLSLDLIGLPPAPQEIDAFLNDRSPDAYEKQVDRLLASPRYGERMAVPWLDAVRFADTVGFHGDQNQNVFPYRDYVIDAFNRNMPFDQFTIEQLAGDLLPHPTTAQLIATGFNRLNMVTREGGAQAREYLAKYAADRVRTVATTWLGATMGCCECHDHKFDPFSTKDFYSMGAFWADVREWGVYADYSYTPNPDLRGYGNDHPFPPEIAVDSAYLHERMDRLTQQIDDVVAASATAIPRDRAAKAGFDAWVNDTNEFLMKNPDGFVELAEEHEPPATQPSTQASAGSTHAKKGKPVPASQLTLALRAGSIAAIRLEALPDAKSGSIFKGKDPKASVQLTATVKTKAGMKTALRFFAADADHKEDRYANGAAILGIKGGWQPDRQEEHAAQTAVYLLESPVKVADGDMLLAQLSSDDLARVRVSISPLGALDPLDTGTPGLLRDAGREGKASPRTLSLLLRTYLLSSAWDSAALSEVRRLDDDLAACRRGKTPAVVTVAWTPRVSRVLPRGNWQDETGEVVAPAVPHFLPQPAEAGTRRLTRLDLARWLVSHDNPLTPRAVMNRTWKQFFGTGLSSTVEDLGAQGEWPSHPELLDWLASEFRDTRWDVKHMIRLMVTSAAYRQDSNLRQDLKDTDPGNRLLASQSPRRLEAEFIRDNALAAAGLLDVSEIGGPSVFPYQPPGYYMNIQFPSREYVASADERQYRRGLYMHWQRTFLHPMLANFDAPSRESTSCTRNVSNTPQQALTLLNDPTFVESARVLAEGALSASPEAGRRFEFIFERCLCRPPRSNERQSLDSFLAQQQAYYLANRAEAEKLVHIGLAPVPPALDVPELAAWTTVCRVVLNLHEMITRY